jgi:hypothetical protein
LLRQFYRPTAREWLEARHPTLKHKLKLAGDIRCKCEKVRLLADVARKRAEVQVDLLDNTQAIFAAQVELRLAALDGDVPEPSSAYLYRVAAADELLESLHEASGAGTGEGGTPDDTDVSVASVADSAGDPAAQCRAQPPDGEPQLVIEGASDAIRVPELSGESGMGQPLLPGQMESGSFLDKIAGLWRWQGAATPLRQSECPHTQPALTVAAGAQ